MHVYSKSKSCSCSYNMKHILKYLALQFWGHPDSLTHNLNWLKILSKKIPLARRIQDLITSGHFNDTEVDYLQIIQDPYSVNFKRPVQVSNQIKQMLTAVMRTKTRNKGISPMLNKCNQETLSTMVEYLSRSVPLCKRVLNEILRLSPDGSMLSFLTIFKDMRTMKQILTPPDANRLVTKLKSADFDIYKNII